MILGVPGPDELSAAIHLLGLAVHDTRVAASLGIPAQVDALATDLVTDHHRVPVGQYLELVQVGGAAVRLVGVGELPVERVRAVPDRRVHAERSARVRVPGDDRVREQAGVHRGSLRITHPPDGRAVRVEHDRVVGDARAEVVGADHIPPRLGLPVEVHAVVGEVLRQAADVVVACIRARIDRESEGPSGGQAHMRRGVTAPGRPAVDGDSGGSRRVEGQSNGADCAGAPIEHPRSERRARPRGHGHRHRPVGGGHAGRRHESPPGGAPGRPRASCVPDTPRHSSP